MRPTFDGKLLAANVYTLGALAGSSGIRGLIDSRVLEEVLVQRWPKVSEVNLAAFHAGFVKGNSPVGVFLGSSQERELQAEGDLGVVG